MSTTVVATTRSGSRYVFLVEADGVRWIRLPAATQANPTVGSLPSPPRVVQGERLMLGTVQSTPVTRVSFLPGPEPIAHGAATHGPEPGICIAVDQAAQPWNLRSLFSGGRH